MLTTSNTSRIEARDSIKAHGMDRLRHDMPTSINEARQHDPTRPNPVVSIRMGSEESVSRKVFAAERTSVCCCGRKSPPSRRMILRPFHSEREMRQVMIWEKLVGTLESGRGRGYIPAPSRLTRDNTTMAAKKKTGKEIYFLVCKETKEQNYTVVLNKTVKSKVFKKYCPKLQRHTEHTPKKV